MIGPNNTGRVYIKPLVAISLIFSFALTAFGLYKLSWPESFAWADTNTLIRFVCFITISTALIAGVSWRFQRNTYCTVLFAITLLSTIAGATWPLLVTLWFAGASAILGYWVLLKLKIKSENLLNCFLVGIGIYGTAIGLLAHFPINYSGVYGLALVLPLVLNWRLVLEKAKSFFANTANTHQNRASFNGLDVAIGVMAMVYVIVALMPELGYDALVSHLFIPAHLLQRHQWGFDASTYVWAVMPMLGDWVFSMGYMLAGETAARLINVGFIFVLGWLIRDMVLWAGGTLLGARWAVLIFLSTPLTFTEGSSLYIESIWASFVVAGVLALLKACSFNSKSRFEIPLAGLLLGTALAAKAITFTILPALLLLLVWRYKSWYKSTGLPFIALGGSLFLTVGVIPYATAWLLTGNPVFPMFNKVFQSPYFSITENFNNQNYNSKLSWDTIYQITFETGKYLEAYAGASGFQWLLLFIPAVLTLIAFKKNRGFALLLIGVLTIAIVFHSQSYLRYVLPSWVILISVIGLALSTVLSVRSFAKNIWIFGVVLTVGLNLIFLNTGNGFYRDFPIKSIFDKASRENYLLTRLPIRNIVELVNYLNVNKSPVAVFADPLTAGLAGDAIYINWYNTSFNKEVSIAQTDQDLANLLLKRNINFVILDANCCNKNGMMQEQIKKITAQIAEYGSLSVRKVKADYKFNTELLANPNFKSVNGWTLNPQVKYDAEKGIILASVESLATQMVVVSPGGKYLNSIEARCAEAPTLGRIQINWLDVKEQITSTDIKTFTCTPAWGNYAMEVIAPQNAVRAIVYVAGHTAIPLEFKSNSLRQ